jgi:hypothetical protein
MQWLQNSTLECKHALHNKIASSDRLTWSNFVSKSINAARKSIMRALVDDLPLELLPPGFRSIADGASNRADVLALPDRRLRMIRSAVQLYHGYCVNRDCVTGVAFNCCSKLYWSQIQLAWLRLPVAERSYFESRYARLNAARAAQRVLDRPRTPIGLGDHPARAAPAAAAIADGTPVRSTLALLDDVASPLPLTVRAYCALEEELSPMLLHCPNSPWERIAAVPLPVAALCAYLRRPGPPCGKSLYLRGAVAREQEFQCASSWVAADRGKVPKQVTYPHQCGSVCRMDISQRMLNGHLDAMRQIVAMNGGCKAISEQNILLAFELENAHGRQVNVQIAWLTACVGLPFYCCFTLNTFTTEPTLPLFPLALYTGLIVRHRRKRHIASALLEALLDFPNFGIGQLYHSVDDELISLFVSIVPALARVRIRSLNFTMVDGDLTQIDSIKVGPLSDIIVIPVAEQKTTAAAKAAAKAKAASKHAQKASVDWANVCAGGADAAPSDDAPDADAAPRELNADPVLEDLGACWEGLDGALQPHMKACNAKAEGLPDPDTRADPICSKTLSVKLVPADLDDILRDVVDVIAFCECTYSVRVVYTDHNAMYTVFPADTPAKLPFGKIVQMTSGSLRVDCGSRLHPRCGFFIDPRGKWAHAVHDCIKWLAHNMVLHRMHTSEADRIQTIYAL